LCRRPAAGPGLALVAAFVAAFVAACTSAPQ